MKYRKRRSAGRSEAIGELLPRLLAALGGKPVLGRLNSLWLAWDEVLGTELAALARPLGRQGAALLLQCQDNMLMQETHLRGPEILQRVNAYLGSECFASLRVCLPKLGRARGGPAAGKRAKKMENAEQRPAPSMPGRATGRYLCGMNPCSPVARAYAAFAACRTGCEAAGRRTR